MKDLIAGVFGGGTKGRLSVDQGRLGNTVNGSKTAVDAWLEETSASASGRSSRGEHVRKESGPVPAHMIFDKDNPADQHSGVAAAVTRSIPTPSTLMLNKLIYERAES